MKAIKAILVLDEMPKSCLDCKLYLFLTCMATRKSNIDGYDCYKNCPLKEMPYKMEQVYGGEDGSEELYDENYMDGWNACLNKIQRNNGI